MIKSVKVIECPNCGSTQATQIKEGYYKCKHCATEYFLTNRDISINVKHDSNRDSEPSSNYIQKYIRDQQNTPLSPMPNNHMVLAIVATILGLCSCLGLIGGIIGIVYASQVASKYKIGDYYEAKKSAKYAKIASIVSLAMSAFGFIVNIIFVVLKDSDLSKQ